MTKAIQDTIGFTLSAEETVVNDTVKIIATIVGMIPNDMDEQKLRDSIRSLIHRFIDVDWQFSNMIRSSHASGQEEITLTATSRVPEKDNFALDRRREEASRDNDLMRITDVSTDTSPTNSQIDETHRKLRLVIIKKADEEMRAINGVTGTDYRLGNIDFHTGISAIASNVRPATMAAASAKVAYGSGFGGEAANDTLGNAVKLTMQATVQLRVTRK